MSEIIPLSVRSYVEIDSGIITKSEDAEMIGQFRYFVSVVQMDEGSLSVWDGDDHSDAIRQANSIAAELSLPIVDRNLGRLH